MIYQSMHDEPLDRGDLFEDCPSVEIASLDLLTPEAAETIVSIARVILLTQTCDLANGKTVSATIAVAYDASYYVDNNLLKPAEIKGPLRSGRIWGLYFLPADAALGLPEMIVDFRRIHTIELERLRTLCRAGKRLGRVRPLYRDRTKRFKDRRPFSSRPTR